MDESYSVNMTEKLQKYFVIQKLIEDIDSTAFFETMLEDATKLGYKVHTFTTQFEPGEYQGTGWRRYTALMVLDVGNYEGVTNIADVPTNEAQRYLEAGWEIASASISTKFVRMIKRATPEALD